MKKLKRIGAFLLGVMSLTCLMFINAFATEIELEEDDGSITIHKLANNVTNLEHDGSQLSNQELNNLLGTTPVPLSGISFTVTQIKGSGDSALDGGQLNVAMAKQLIAENESRYGTELYRDTMETRSDGTAVFDDLPLGYYLVEEIANSQITGVIAPFLIKLPLTNATGDELIYDVHVYPKNTEMSMTKTIDDGSKDGILSDTKKIGDEVTWSIKSTIPSYVASIDLSDGGYYYITDELNFALDYKSTVVELVDGKGSVQQTLVNGTHYTLHEPNVAGEYIGGGTVKVDFNIQSELEGVLAEAMQNGYFVKVTIKTTINEAILPVFGSIINTADLEFKKDSTDASHKVEPDTDPEVKVSGISIIKLNEIGAVLDGATFTVYASEEDARNNKNSIASAVTGAVGKHIAGTIYFTLDDLGVTLGDSEIPLYIVETKAPEGYQLAGVIKKIVLSKNHPGENWTLKNEKLSKDFTLPITGGSGTILFTIAGLGLIGLAIVLFIAMRKKNSNEN